MSLAPKLYFLFLSSVVIIGSAVLPSKVSAANVNFLSDTNFVLDGLVPAFGFSVASGSTADAFVVNSTNTVITVSDGVSSSTLTATSSFIVSGTATANQTYINATATLVISGTGTATITSGGAINPVPALTSINPAIVAGLVDSLLLTVNGSSFLSTSVINWNGAPVSTVYVSPTELTAVIPGASISFPGTASVTVSNPAPGGGTSGPQTLTAIIPANVQVAYGGTYTPPLVNPAPAPTSTAVQATSSLSSSTASTSLQVQINILLAKVKELQSRLSNQTNFKFVHDLQYGLRNNTEVRLLQNMLTKDGVYTGPITGNFLSQTYWAVVRFQTKHNISPAAGYVGAKTRGLLNGM